jgi:hypothetical protein
MNNNVVFIKSVMIPDFYTVFADSTRKGSIKKEGKQWILTLFTKPHYYTFKGSLADCVQEAREML